MGGGGGGAPYFETAYIKNTFGLYIASFPPCAMAQSRDSKCYANLSVN